MKSFISDAVDYKGDPADRSTTGGWVYAALILGIEVIERLSTMGTAVNLVTYLIGTMHLSSATSANMVTNFAGTSFLLSLAGGYLADSFLGRYWTITIFAVTHALGTCILAIFTVLPQLHPSPCSPALSNKCEEPNSMQMTVLYMALYSIALGIGGLKSSVSGFGTDQFDQNDKKEKSQMAYFFNRFYLFINIGTLLAVTVLVYIQDNVSRSWGYGICSATMFLAVFSFLLGTKRYRYKKCVGSPVVHILQVIVAAIKKRKLALPSSVNFLHEDSSKESRIYHTDQFRCLDKASIMVSEDYGPNGSQTPNPWMLSTVTKVEEVKMMIKLMPIWATTIMFWTTHAQMLTFSVQQASTMERSIGKFQIPPASFNVFFTGSIMLTLAIYDRAIMPMFKNIKGNQGFTSLQKIGIGIFFSVMAMAAAALVEVRRLSVAKSHATSTVPLSAFMLIPQFALVGVGEAFIYTGQLDFFITQSPKGMKAISTGLFLTTISLGFFVSSVLVTIVKQVTGGRGGHNWLAPKIDDSRLDCFYGLLAVLSFIDLGFYLVCAKWYKPNVAPSDEQMDSVINVAPREDRV